MNKKILLLCFIFVLTLSLCGCQLAKADGLETQGDRLIGVLITSEYLDLFDMDRYLNDHISSLSDGGTINVENDSRYEGRIYATLKSQMRTYEEAGETSETWDWEYVFEDLGGVPLFCVEITPPEGDSFFSSSSGSGVSDVHLAVGIDTTIEGTIYATFSSADQVYYVNPVYQSSDGRVYATSGSGYSTSGNMDEGSVFTATLEEKHTVTENGEKREESFKVTVNIAIKYPPVSVSILQMNAENTPVSREEYSPDDLPENVAIGPDTEYVIVETRSTSPDGEILSREIFAPSDEYFTSYNAREDGICEAKMVTLVWGE